ncbi:sugar ABC transporter substrate-binding protein [Nocardioides terrisoli]|uniref:sugar ABC transporter substrate-binding protein n=1 Tax=Nocardioides terrisoli TaxID=3388267 RepID=UPI00287BC2D4|nr:substrate-binding domain-containing protein [Nocardioides marmorisolisilvae]
MAHLKKGTEQTPPTTGPTPKKGLTIAYVSCGQVSPGCKDPGTGLEDAATELGWTVKTFDGKFNVGGGYSTAFRQAIAIKPDAIATAGIDCAQVRQSLVAAKAAKIPVFDMLGSDCDANGGQKLFAADIIYRRGVTSAAQFYEAWGRQKVQYLEAKLGGHVNLIDVHFNDVLPSLDQGVRSEIAKCSGCRIVGDVAVGTADSASPQGPIVPGVQSALLRRPDANALLVPFDTQLMVTGLLQALENSPTGRKLVVTGGEGSPAGIQALDRGPIPTAVEGYSNEWMGYAFADAINRYLNGAPQAPEGFGTRVVEKGEAPSSGPYAAALDFKAAYRKAWGLTK